MLLCSELYYVLYNFTAKENEFSCDILLNPQIEQKNPWDGKWSSLIHFSGKLIFNPNFVSFKRKGATKKSGISNKLDFD